MKKFNLFKENIIISREELNEAKNSSQEFGIDIYGAIHKKPIPKSAILVYKGVGSKNMTIADLFDNSYRINQDEKNITINTGGAWRNILELNRANATYDDSSADGIDRFATKDMEDIGWHATEFNISYRTLAEVLEEKCDGVLLCIEQDEPYQFSGLGFVPDLYDAKNRMFDYCQSEIKRLIAEDEEFEEAFLSYEQIEAAAFFKILTI